MGGSINMIKIAPSILSADFADLGRDVERLSNAGADFIHIDVMDKTFVDNVAYSMEEIREINEISNKKLDVHLMVNDPFRYIDNLNETEENEDEYGD